MKKVLYLIVFFSFPVMLYAQHDDLRKNNFNIKKDIAIEGYDPVSYFDAKPAEGKAQFKSVYKGITYFFINKINLEKFNSNPASYEPAYGGWCAYAMGHSGEKVKIDPETYKIEAGRLYLFYNFWGNNTLTDWNKNDKELKAKGDSNWAKIFH